MRAKTISVTGNWHCGMRSTPVGSMARACNRRVTLFRSMAAMATLRISLRPTRNCRAVQTLPTPWTMSRKRSGGTSSMAPIGIKLMGTGGVADLTSDFKVQELSEEQMAKAVEVAHRAGKRVMVHAEGTEGIKAAVRAGVDSIEHGTMLDDEGAALMAQRGTWLVPTLYTFQFGAAQGEKLGLEPVMLAKVRRIISAQGPA